MDRKALLLIIFATGFVGLFLGFVFSLSVIEPPNQRNLPVFSEDEIESKNKLLKEYIDEQSYLQSRITTLRSKIDDSQKTLEEHSKTATIEKLNNLKKDIGLTEIKGSGVEILLRDSKNSGLVQASDVRDIVNLLRAAKASAISVNNQRIISTSTISSVGTAILVNNSYIVPPIYISAVGDQDMIMQRITNQSLLPSIYDRFKKKYIVFQADTKWNLIIPAYSGDLNADYINLVE